MKRLDHLKSILANDDAFRLRRGSYSQSGEDLIIRFIFDVIGVKKPSYIDIGAHDPFYLNNTAILYEQGSRGINVEPDQQLFSRFEKYRREDVNLNCGVGKTDGELMLHVMNIPTTNTFSAEEAERLVRENKMTIVKKVPVQMLSLPTIIKKYCNGVFPDFMNLDIEGMDEDVVRAIDENNSFPTIICLETISYSETGEGKKNKAMIDLLESKGYMVYADTFINTIFVRKDKWLKK